MPSPHPLDPFTPDELRQAVAILRQSGKLSDDVRFSGAFPIEPPKDLVRGFSAGTPFERELRLVGYDRERTGSFDAHISLSRERVVGFVKVEQGQAPPSTMDVERMIRIVKADPQWRRAMRKRGIEDLSLVHIDSWPAGGYPPKELPEGSRLLRATSFLRTHEKDNGYARPVEGVMAYVDLDNEKVARLDDHGVVPMPPESGAYDAGLRARARRSA